jgi:hypothetical protein
MDPTDIELVAQLIAGLIEQARQDQTRAPELLRAIAAAALGDRDPLAGLVAAARDQTCEALGAMQELDI